MSALKLGARDVWSRHAEIYATAVKDRLKSSLKNRPLTQKVGAVVSEVVYSGTLLAVDIFLPNSIRTRALVQGAKHVSDEIFDNPFTRAQADIEQARQIHLINVSLSHQIAASEKELNESRIRLDESEAKLQESRALLKTQADQLRRQAEKLRKQSERLVARELFRVQWNPETRAKVQAKAANATKAKQRKFSARLAVRRTSTMDRESRISSSVLSDSDPPIYVESPVATEQRDKLEQLRGLGVSRKRLPTPPFSPTSSSLSYLPDNEYVSSADKTPQPLHGLPTPAESMSFRLLQDAPPIVEKADSPVSDGIDVDTPPAAEEPNSDVQPTAFTRPRLPSTSSTTSSSSHIRPPNMMRMRTTSLGIHGAGVRPLNGHPHASQS